MTLAERNTSETPADVSTNSSPFSTDWVQFPKLRDPRYPVHQIADRLEPYLRAIVEKCHPERIILFGSYAYGQPNEHSDVDLLVIQNQVRSARESRLAVRRAFREVPGRPLPFTVLSETPESLEQKLMLGSHFYHDITMKGVQLYVRKTAQRH